MTKDKKIVLFFLFLAFLIRIILAIFLFGKDDFPPNDGYHEIATNLLQGRGFIESDFYRSQRPPLYPFLLFLIYRVFGCSPLAVFITQSLVGALVCLFIYFLALQVFGKKTAILSIGVSTVYPPLAFYSITIATEPFYIFFLLLFALFFNQSLRLNLKRYIILSGIFLGLATLTRAQGLSFFIYVIISLLLFSKDKISRRFKDGGMILLIALLVILPWSIRNFAIHKHIVPIAIQAGKVFYEANNPLIIDEPVRWGRNLAVEELPGYKETETLNEYEKDRAFLNLGLGFIKKNPDKIPKLIFNKFIRFWNIFPHIRRSWQAIYLLTYGLLLPFMIVGIISSLWIKNYSAIALILVIVWVNISSLIFWGGARMRVPASPYIVIFAAYGIIQVLKRLRLFVT